MKRFLILLGAVGITALVTFLAVTKHLSEERSVRLNRALMDAEARLMELETRNEVLQHQVLELTKDLETERVQPGKPSDRTTARNAHTETPGAGPSAASPATKSQETLPPLVLPVDWVRYASFASSSNRILIKGTSSIHDWQVQGRLIGGGAELPADFPATPASEVRSNPVPVKVAVMVPVRSLTSIESDGRPYSTAMDDIMYRKLMADSFNRITFALESLTFRDALAGVSSRFAYDAWGQLAVAGITNRINMPVIAAAIAPDKIHFEGQVDLKMTDFGITPPAPSFAGGAIKTGDSVRVLFSWVVRRSNQVALR